MRAIFRTDASIKIGSGHVQRCLTLANELTKEGIRVEFFCRNLISNMKSFIIAKGFKVNESFFELSTKNQSPNNSKTPELDEKLDQLKDVSILKSLIKKKISIVIIDHYEIDFKWETAIRPFVNSIFVIDDLANRKHECDFILDQNRFEDENAYDNLIPSRAIKLFGPKYALLRNEFLVERKKGLVKRNKIKRIFVFFSGVDEPGLTILALQALIYKKFNHLIIDVVVGSQNPNMDKIKAITKTYKNMNLYVQVDNIAKIMKKADLAIGSGGVNAWERICLKLPSIVIEMADNQSNLISKLDRYNVINFLGHKDNITLNKLRNCIINVITDGNYNSEFSKVRCDGMGSSRVFKKIYNTF